MAKNDFQSLLDKIHVDDIKAQIDIAPVTLGVTDKHKNELSAVTVGFEFRPLTAEEKKEIQNSLDGGSKEILLELQPK